uniref:Uncharacterized protein n=1 Tax=Panagrolaimus sp. ES5 TaxID=591445 RepID=A0AC34F661_9BILA
MDLEVIEKDLNSLTIGDSDSISDVISNIKNKFDPEHFINEHNVRNATTYFHNYTTAFNEMLNTPYIEADVHYDSLDTGANPTQMSRETVERYKAPGDCPGQFISKSLGGDGHPKNVYPLNPKL